MPIKADSFLAKLKTCIIFNNNSLYIKNELSVAIAKHINNLACAYITQLICMCLYTLPFHSNCV